MATGLARGQPQPFLHVEENGPPAADTREARRLIRELGASFSADYSDHYTIVTDAAPAEGRAILRRAERALSRVEKFTKGLNLWTWRLSRKMSLVYFNSWDAYARYSGGAGFVVSPTVPGFFDQRSGRCILFNYANSQLILKKRAEIDQARRQVETSQPADRAAAKAEIRRIREIEARLDQHEALINATVLQHELAHQALFHLGVQTAAMRDRRWLCEGLAMQFEADEAVNPYRLADFLAIDWARPPFSLRELVSDPRVTGPGGADSVAAYSAAWALVHYLVSTQPKQFARYLRTPIGRPTAESEIAAFEAAFGALDGAFERKWHETMKELLPR